MKNNFSLILFLILTSFINCFAATTAESQKIKDSVSKSIEIFSELETLRREEMSLLRFDNSPVKVNSSRSYKFVLRDQTGRDWLFKAGASSSMDGAIAVHRISTLLGVLSPRMHYKKIEINGTEITGSLQELIPDVKGFTGNWAALNEKSRDYVLKNHVLSWLLANHHVHPDQFLIRKSTSDEQQLIRIDNSINWMLFGSDRLDIEYRSPMLSQTPFAGYSDFWNQYLFSGQKFNKIFSEREGIKDTFMVKYDLNLNEALLLTKYIGLIPEDYYKDFFSFCVKNNLFFTSNNEAIAAAWLTPVNYIKYGDKTKFLDRVLARKDSIFNDYSKFFAELSDLRGEKWNPDLSEKQLLQFIDKINLAHLSEIKQVKKSLESLKKLTLEPQKNVVRPVSLDLYYIMNRLGESLRFNKQSQFTKLLAELKKQLMAYKKSNKVESQNAAIDNAIANLEDLTKYAEKNDFDKVMYFWIAVNSNQLFDVDYVKEKLKSNPYKYVK